MDFSSDNSYGVHPSIMDAVVAANDGPAPSYGGDRISARVVERFRDLFETDLDVFTVPTGSAANGLAISSFCSSLSAIFAHSEAHVSVEECGAAEVLSGGARLVPVGGFGAKIEPDALTDALAQYPPDFNRVHIPSMLALTQATECGTVYTAGEIATLTEIARARSMSVHMDGARFANAVVSLGVAPADLTWRAGVDVMTFGATKNGAMSVDAIILFDRGRASEMDRRRLRGGHLFSKMRFASAQLDAYLADDLWLKLAGDANDAAARLSAGLATVEGVRLVWPTEANEVFVIMPTGLVRHLEDAGARYHPWPPIGLKGSAAAPGEEEILMRLICSFETGTDRVDALLEAAAQYRG